MVKLFFQKEISYINKTIWLYYINKTMWSSNFQQEKIIYLVLFILYSFELKQNAEATKLCHLIDF